MPLIACLLKAKIIVKGNVKTKPAISPMCEPLKLFRMFFVLLYCSVYKIVVVLRG